MDTKENSIKHIDNIPWERHPFLRDVRIKRIISCVDGLGLTYCLASVEKGQQIRTHVHKDSEDYLFIIEGKGRMFLEHVGEFDLNSGVFVRVAKGKKHGIVRVDESLLFIDIFHPEAY